VHTCLFEGFANAIIEAMACAVPVIALDCHYGPRDIIRHRENGLLVPMNNEEALVDAVMTLLREKPLQENIAKRGLERAHDFSMTSMVQSYEKFFHQIYNVKSFMKKE
jgi:glycosyltransferase involved in cell wall biosynthesis